MNNRKSIATIDNPQFINLQPMDINPMISRCEIKVLYIGQNRNGSFITKEVATEMSKTLRGCPIIGYYIESKQDFGDHGDQMIIDGEGVRFNKLTKPYGFVSENARVWFQFFEDTDEFGNTCLREYLMTEGYLWTGQFEECQRVLDNSNPQSMELDESTLDGFWSTDNNKGIDFFIINRATISSLCILGDDVEPCFEGARVTSPTISSNFSNEEFAKSLYSMMKELKFALTNNKGGQPMLDENENVVGKENEPTSFENEIKVAAPETNFEDAAGGDAAGSESSEGAAGETSGSQSSEGGDQGAGSDPTQGTQGGEQGDSNQDPAADNDSSIVLNDVDQSIINDLMADPNSDYAPAGETTKEAVIKDGATNVGKQQEFKKKDEEDKDSKGKDNAEDDSEDKKDDANGEEKADEEDKDKKKKFSLQEELDNLRVEFASLQEENKKLLAFKQKVENKEKDDLIASFYMLSDEDKKNVIENKDKFSLKEIKAELSMICVDKKVTFNMEKKEEEVPITYNCNSHEASTLPTWLQAVEAVKNNRNN